MSTATEEQNSDHVSGAALRAVMRQVPTPVTVVTARSGEGGQPFGITIGSFASVSLEPPLVSFNVSEGARTYQRMADVERFAVHVLGRDQSPLALRFADPDLSAAEQFEGIAWESDPDGTPVLKDVLAVLHCRLHTRFRAGDSDVIVGRVMRVENAALAADPRGVPSTGPLVYHQQNYRTVKAAARVASDQASDASEPEKRSASRAPETPAPKRAKS